VARVRCRYQSLLSVFLLLQGLVGESFRELSLSGF
jgi:hypothetical protein